MIDFETSSSTLLTLSRGRSTQSSPSMSASGRKASSSCVARAASGKVKTMRPKKRPVSGSSNWCASLISPPWRNISAVIRVTMPG